jgi:hypothetical protein
LPEVGAGVQVEFNGVLHGAHVKSVSATRVHLEYDGLGPGGKPWLESMPLSEARERVVEAW